MKINCLRPTALLIVIMLFIFGFCLASASSSIMHPLVGDIGDDYATVQILPDEDAMLYISYATSDSKTNTTDKYEISAGEVLNVKLDGLIPDKEYSYVIHYAIDGSNIFLGKAEGSFHTQRGTGSSFVFTVQSDSHRDAMTDEVLYRNTLKNILADKPDFHIDLGDTFMTEKFAKSEGEVINRYLEDRRFFETIGSSIPIYLANGNHEGENGFLLVKGADSLAVWASNARNKYFINPSPGGIFEINASADKYAGMRGGYYAWEWGDVLFVVLDPFWNSLKKSGSLADNWNYSLGKDQYDWLKSVLAKSNASYKFVFCHNLVGGLDKDARGGAEAAAYFEWGGKNADGSYGFDSKRNGWGEPIHNVLVEYGVDVVFHGHDHFYAEQELDGVIYQLVPQPGHPGTKDFKLPKEYGYQEGVFLPSSGHLRVSISPEKAVVEYVASRIGKPADGIGNMAVVHAYSISPN